MKPVTATDTPLANLNSTSEKLNIRASVVNIGIQITLYTDVTGVKVGSFICSLYYRVLNRCWSCKQRSLLFKDG